MFTPNWPNLRKFPFLSFFVSSDQAVLTMSQPVPSFQDVVHPLQELAKFKTKLQTCQHMLSDLQKSIPAFLPDADIQISVANQSLHHI